MAELLRTAARHPRLWRFEFPRDPLRRDPIHAREALHLGVRGDDEAGASPERAGSCPSLEPAVLLVAKHKVLHSAKKSSLLEPATVDLYNSLIDKELNG